MRPLLIILSLLSPLLLVHAIDCPFHEDETISFAPGKLEETRAFTVDGSCKWASKLFKLEQPPQLFKHMKVTLQEAKVHSGKLRVNVMEYYAHEGVEMGIPRSNLTAVNQSVVASALSTLTISVMTNDFAQATVVLKFTLENEGCPLPLIYLREGQTITFPAEYLKHECDLDFKTEATKSVLVLTSVSAVNATGAFIKIIDHFTQQTIETIDESQFSTIENLMLHTPRILFHARNPGKVAVNPSGAFVSFRVDKLVCDCPPAAFEFKDASSRFSFKMVQSHCYSENCVSTILIADELRHNHRIKVEPNFGDESVRGIMLIKDGISEGLPMDNVLGESENPVFISEHPTLQLIHNDLVHPSDVRMDVTLVEVSEEEQALCKCPSFVSTKEDDWELHIRFAPICGPIDCVWSVPVITKSYALEDIYVSSDRSAYGHVDVDAEQLFVAHRENDGMTWFTKYKHGLNFITPRDRNAHAVFENHTIVHYHRTRRTEFAYNFTVQLRAYPNMKSYEENCGCFNTTVDLGADGVFNYSTPRHPLHYCDSLHCRTTFVAAPGYNVLFEVKGNISLQKGADWLYISDIVDGERFVHEKYTGVYMQGFPTQSKTNQMEVLFTSDGSVNYDGLFALVSTVDDGTGTAATAAPSKKKKDSTEKGSGVASKVFLFIVSVALVLIAAAVWRKRRNASVILSFAPVSYFNGGRENGDNDESSRVRFS